MYLEQKCLGLRSSLFGPIELPFALPVENRDTRVLSVRGAKCSEDTVYLHVLTLPARKYYLCSNAANRRESKIFSSGSQVLYLRTKHEVRLRKRALTHTRTDTQRQTERVAAAAAAAVLARELRSPSLCTVLIRLYSYSSSL